MMAQGARGLEIPAMKPGEGSLSFTTTVFASGVSMAATGRMIAAEAPTRP